MVERSAMRPYCAMSRAPLATVSSGHYWSDVGQLGARGSGRPGVHGGEHASWHEEVAKMSSKSSRVKETPAHLPG